MKKLLFLSLLCLICPTMFAGLCYVELAPAEWSQQGDVFSFEQQVPIVYTENCDDLLGWKINLPDLLVDGDTVTSLGNLEAYDLDDQLILTASFDIGTYFEGLRTDIVFYNIDITLPESGYLLDDAEMELFSIGTKAGTFECSMTLTQAAPIIPEPFTVTLFGMGSILLVCKRKV